VEVAADFYSFVKLLMEGKGTYILEAILSLSMLDASIQGSKYYCLLKEVIEDWKYFISDVETFYKYLVVCKIFEEPASRRVKQILLKIKKPPTGIADYISRNTQWRLTQGSCPDNIDLYSAVRSLNALRAIAVRPRQLSIFTFSIKLHDLMKCFFWYPTTRPQNYS